MREDGALSCIQSHAPTTRSYPQAPVASSAEPATCVSVRAMSPLLHTPMVGACTAGNATGGATQDSGGTLARYQLRAGVSDLVASSSAMTASVSGWRAQERELAQLLSLSHCSATAANRNKTMYQDLSGWSSGRRKVEGWPTDSATR